MEIYILYDTDKDVIGIFSKDVTSELKEIGIDVKGLEIKKINLDTIYNHLNLNQISQLSKSMNIFEVDYSRNNNTFHVIDFRSLSKVHMLLGLDKTCDSISNIISIRIFADNEKDAIEKAIKIFKKEDYKL